MSRHTFAQWLYNEAASARHTLLSLYEQRERLLYIEGPRLEKEYMDKIGSYEETVIREEIECELLQMKQQMIQAALNRREPIDEAAIDKELEEHRRQMLREAAGTEAPQEYAELSTEQTNELQQLYSEILKDFHPQMHPELKEAQRHLYDKAQEAYRHRDVDALRLIHEMLYSQEEVPQELLRELLAGDNGSEMAKDEIARGMEYAADYSLAAEIYSSFVPTDEEAVLREECARCRQMTDSVIGEMQEIRLRFPYTASGMLSDPAKTEAYKEELALRFRAATAERERRTKEICAMIEGVTVHE
ncbi:MAG: hypothetical protein E7559_02645 [Ruminococcaceae bacterium]|nr:hypothetical protein [Oscillospiraceae bacterium]